MQESKPKGAIEPLSDEFEIQSFTDGQNGIWYGGGYMPKYFTQKLKDRVGYSMVCLKIDNFNLSSIELLKQYFFDEKCLLVDKMADLPKVSEP